MASSGVKFKTRDDWRKAKELEEARKAGTAPAALDEDGNEINPHIPQYIAQAPWYLNKDHATLSHQRKGKHEEREKRWYARGQKAGPAATKYRKGACENCGAMTHKKRDCLERPRKKGAKWTEKKIAADEVLVSDLRLDYDAARDRWNGYDPAEHAKVMERFEKLDEERKRRRQQSLNSFMTEPDAEQARFPVQGGGAQTAATAQSGADGGGGGSADEAAAAAAALLDDSDSDEDGEDDVRLKGTEEMAGSKVDGRTRTTIRNLRIREDTAKYLRNLDVESAYYDPKTRSMRENPLPGKAETLYEGDNKVRRSGDAQRFEQLQRFVWDAQNKGTDVHFAANPSQAELAHKQFEEKRRELEGRKKKKVLEKYGGEEFLREAPKALLYGQTEQYVEYAADGSVVRDGQKVVARSKWEEDVLENNHAHVWGSFWRDGAWGYACCHQTTRNSYCTGEAGRRSTRVSLEEMEQMQRAQQERLKRAAEEAEARKKKEAEGREERLQKALDAEEERAGYVEMDERKRKYNSMQADSLDVTEEEMEAYRLKRRRFDDPMKDFLHE